MGHPFSPGFALEVDSWCTDLCSPASQQTLVVFENIIAKAHPAIAGNDAKMINTETVDGVCGEMMVCTDEVRLFTGWLPVEIDHFLTFP